VAGAGRKTLAVTAAATGKKAGAGSKGKILPSPEQVFLYALHRLAPIPCTESRNVTAA